MNKHRGQVPSPMLGEGTYLQFRWRDLAAIEGYAGQKRWFEKICDDIDGFSQTTIAAVIGIGLKNHQGISVTAGKPFEPSEEQELTLMECIPLILDALYLSVHGKTFNEFVQERVEISKKEAEAALGGAEENPLNGLVDSSNKQDGTPSRPVSNPTSSGN